MSTGNGLSQGDGEGTCRADKTAGWSREHETLDNDNALAESVIGLYNAELVHQRGPWRGCDDIAFATLEWVDWFNNRRLFGAIGYVPPAEYQASCYPEIVPALAGTQ